MEFDLTSIIGAVADAVPDRDCFVQGGVRLTFGELVGRSNQFAHALHELGLGCHTERDRLAGHESGQDHLGLYLHNGHEFIEANIGAFAARLAPFNINYRYVDDELIYLLRDQRARVLVYHDAFAPIVERIRGHLDDLVGLFQVTDDSGHGLLRGAVRYEDALRGRPTSPPPLTRSPDDLYVLCTGGTTGMPKGVLWRQADIWVSALGGVSPKLGREYASVDEIADEAQRRGGFRNMPTAPFMHGAAQWAALTALTHGNTCVIPESPTRLDPHDVWSTVEREGVTLLQIVGDSFARPLLDQLDRGSYDVSSLRVITNGGAILGAGSKERLVAAIPRLLIVDGLGSSEAGPIGTSQSSNSTGITAAAFEPAPGTRVLSSDLSSVLGPGTGSLGWLATTGRIPLGYLGDAAKTAATFPTVAGVRHAVPGDRAVLLDDGRIELRGRDSVTINTGGEKVFAEEVEQAILHHPSVADAVVCGRPSERWGQEVVAIVALADGATGSDEIAAAIVEAAGVTLARYKLPKRIVFRPAIERSPAGKADYRWAAAQAAG